MEIRHLKTFYTVAKLSSFNRAAKHLSYAQSSVSAQIKSLEDDLNVQLFDRLGRRIMLTEAGHRLIGYAQKILDIAEETKVEVANIKKPRGSLTIRMPETIGVYEMVPVIKRFRTSFPDIRLKFISCDHKGLEEDLRKGLTDLAFFLTESIQAKDLNATILKFEQLVMVAHPEHPLANKTVVRNRDLKNETHLLSKVDCSHRRTYQQILDKEKIHPRKLIEINSVAAIKTCVMEGVGVAILPNASVNRDITKGRLAPLAWEDGSIEVALMMIWYKHRWLSPTLKAFMNVTKKILCT